MHHLWIHCPDFARHQVRWTLQPYSLSEGGSRICVCSLLSNVISSSNSSPSAGFTVPQMFLWIAFALATVRQVPSSSSTLGWICSNILTQPAHFWGVGMSTCLASLRNPPNRWILTLQSMLVHPRGVLLYKAIFKDTFNGVVRWSLPKKSRNPILRLGIAGLCRLPPSW